MTSIIFTTAAARDLDALAADGREQVQGGLIRAGAAEAGDTEQLRGRDGYRLRLGRHRVIFDADRQTILAIYAANRLTPSYRTP